MPATTLIRSVRDQIASRLRSELLGGRYEPGTAFREEGLAERFGVSRMPVRNALQELVHEGLLVAKRNCGVTVAAPPDATVNDLLTPLRVQLVTYALRLCLARSGGTRRSPITGLSRSFTSDCSTCFSLAT